MNDIDMYYCLLLLFLSTELAYLETGKKITETGQDGNLLTF